VAEPEETSAAPGSVFGRVKRSSASADASRLIKDVVLTGRLQPGDRLPPERELAEMLGVSRPTVRESIRALVAMNILESRHGAGTFVASLETGQLLEPLQFVLARAERVLGDLFETRLVIEPPIAALAAARASQKEAAAILACAREAKQVADPPAQVLLELDVRLHTLIAAASHNQLLARLHDSISALGVESRSLTVGLPGVAARTVGDHEAIAEAIAEHDAERAGAAMRHHLQSLADSASNATPRHPSPHADPAPSTPDSPRP
jgi:GntR family transcriptional regulator, transcriptional repressor for pyruvate dehydrogenase complex